MFYIVFNIFNVYSTTYKRIKKTSAFLLFSFHLTYFFAAIQCSDDRFLMFNNSCYLFVSYPEVTWSTAQQICSGMNAHLTSVQTAEEEKFLTTNLRKMPEYRTSARYWLGGKADVSGTFFWTDGTEMKYVGWLPGFKLIDNEITLSNEGQLCLSVQWMPSPTTILPSGLYWKSQKCNSMGGYVCKRKNLFPGAGINFNRTLNGTEGTVQSPNYPGNYYNNLDFIITIVSPERTRIVLQFENIDLEYQQECLYDYIELKSGGILSNKSKKICGNYETEMNRFDYVSEYNEVFVFFHSDYSITGNGFSLQWHSVDVSGCPKQTLTAKEGTIQSPNYPNGLLPNLDCTYSIIAPKGRRVWLEFQNFDFKNSNMRDSKNFYLDSKSFNPIDFDSKNFNPLDLKSSKTAKIYLGEVLEIKLGEHSPFFRPYQTEELLSEGSFVSTSEQLEIRIKTNENPFGRGFKATYKTSRIIQENKIIKLTNETCGSLLHLNYPNRAPDNVDFIQNLMAPLGYVISLELHHLKLVEKNCPFEQGSIEIYDHYADVNGTRWYLCQDVEDSFFPKTPIAIISFLNTLHVRQRNRQLGISLNGTVKVLSDTKYKNKLLNFNNYSVESCNPSPCNNGGKCILGTRKFCQCLGHFTGKY